MIPVYYFELLFIFHLALYLCINTGGSFATNIMQRQESLRETLTDLKAMLMILFACHLPYIVKGIVLQWRKG